MKHNLSFFVFTDKARHPKNISNETSMDCLSHNQSKFQSKLFEANISKTRLYKTFVNKCDSQIGFLIKMNGMKTSKVFG